MNIYLIRHAKTEGNLKRQYIGITDEPVCEIGKKELIDRQEADIYPKVDYIYSSPMLRCRQTCQILYRNESFEIIPELSECDFGDFEGKNYAQLKDDPKYRDWINNNATGMIPGGESVIAFKQRSCRAFQRIVDEVINNTYDTVAVILHGGTIMAILESFSKEKRDFYSWKVENAQGYRLIIDKDLWKKEKKIKEIIKL